MTSDEITTVADLRSAVQRFVARRNWGVFHTPKNLAMSIAIEAAEIMEHFQWISIEESQQRVQPLAVRAEVADELADVLIYCLSFANSIDVDVTAAVLAKLARNEVRFPVDRVYGQLGSEQLGSEQVESEQLGSQ